MKKRIILGISIALVSIILIGVITSVFYYKSSIKAVDSNNKEAVTFKVEQNTTTNQILDNLKESNLIKDTFTAKIYIKLHKINNIQAGNYSLNKSMSLEEILNIFTSGKVINENIQIRFTEGKRLKDYAKVISSKTSYSEEEVLNKLKDEEFLNRLINNYWFITDEILNKNILYPLEGYLYPDTYEFEKDETLENIILKLINTLEQKLEPYKQKIEQSEMTVHEYLTLASIVELEAAKEEDRQVIASILYNRLKSGITLGCDTTTYYPVGKTFTDGLTYQDLNACNAYNTRGNCVKALPVGPIASPGYVSIQASIDPIETDYYFFVSDNTKKIYPARNESEHYQIISRLKKEGLWDF